MQYVLCCLWNTIISELCQRSTRKSNIIAESWEKTLNRDITDIVRILGTVMRVIQLSFQLWYGKLKIKKSISWANRKSYPKSYQCESKRCSICSLWKVNLLNVRTTSDYVNSRNETFFCVHNLKKYLLEESKSGHQSHHKQFLILHLCDICLLQNWLSPLCFLFVFFHMLLPDFIDVCIKNSW